MKNLIAAVALLPSLAYANFFEASVAVLCGPTSEILNTIKEFKEENSFVGVEDAGALVTLWINQETGTYTIVKTSRTNNELSCVFGTGNTQQKGKLL
jgi:hypothetical protein